MCKKVYDNNGYLISCKYNDGDWYEYTRDRRGNILTYKDKHGLIKYLSGDKKYGLYYRHGLYIAGCKSFTYKKAINYCNTVIANYNSSPSFKNFNRVLTASKFLNAIELHHSGLSLKDKLWEMLPEIYLDICLLMGRRDIDLLYKRIYLSRS